MAGYGGALSRRGLIAGAAALAAARPAVAAQAVAAPGPGRTRPMSTAMRASGRPVNQTEAQFDAIQARKPAAMKRIEAYLKQHLGTRRPRA